MRDVLADARDPAVAPRRLGRYLLRYLIAQGGMASVYLGQLQAAPGFQKWVAVKVIHPHIASDRRFVRMFLNEARLAARLDHPNLCSVFDYGEAEGTSFLAMEYLHGESLGALAKRAWRASGLPLTLGARVLADAARGLHAAHELRREDGALAGVVHRDVSPQNLFVLYSGITKVVDFGVARSDEHLGERTAAGEVKGKLAYMSPEQLQDRALDRRADVWALGVVLWEVTVGKRLFKRGHDAATILAVLTDPIPRPSEVREDYPRDLEAVVHGALERDPSRRFPTALDLARALESWLASQGVPSGQDDVGALMRALFAQQITFREELLRRVGVDAPLEVVDRWASDGSFDLGSHSHSSSRSDLPLPVPVSELPRPSPDPALDPTLTEARAPSSRPRPSGRTLTALLALLLVPVALAVGWSLPRGPRTTPPSSSRPAPSRSPSPPREPDPAPPHAAPSPEARTPPEAPAPVPAPTVVPTVAPRGRPSRPTRPVAVTPPRPRPRPAEPEEADPEPPPEGRRPGYLNLSSTPRAEVFEGSRSLGMTPIVDRRMPSGSHTFRLVPTDGSDPRSITVEVQPGATSVASIRW